MFLLSNFRRKCMVTTAATMLVLSMVIPVKAAVPSSTVFTDVSKRYSQSVDYLVANQFSNGISPSQFGTNLSITRGSAAIILANALGISNGDAPASGFVDVPKRGMAAINALKEKGIIGGKSATKFGFDELLKRGEVALMLANASSYNLKGNQETPTFADVNARYREAVAGLVENGVTNGKTEHRFGTDDPIKRGEYAIFIYKAEMIGKENTLPDSYSALHKRLMAKDVSTIKLLGDSITAGVGVKSYYIAQDGRVIFNDGKGQVYREAAHTAETWANQLRTYTKNTAFGQVDVMNSGISGKTAKWTLENIDYLLKQQEDVVFVMMGTNDRIDSSLKEYEVTSRKLLELVDKRSNYMVVMSPPPSINTIYPYQFSPKDIDAVLKKISKEKGYPFISHFDGMNDYLAEHGDVTYEDLMQTNSPHPIEAGYEVMWQRIKAGLELE
ncbi:S-layer homology domain-containing protein [Sporosarcina sp. NPDC096371]|uniref:S-layer homology domain-containing protein n=1 Tax=Sporosarcina sp. NPDC096371 TaxID=3364530 RepID=UPI003804B43A